MRRVFPVITVCFLACAPGAEGTEILNLYDAFGEAREGTQKDFGFSALVRHQGKTILFDAGTSADVLRKNAEALGVDLSEVDFAVASHAHADHIGGFDYLIQMNPDVTIYMPSDFFGAGGPLDFNVAGAEPDIAGELPPEQRYFGGESTIAHLRTDGRFYKAVEYISENREIAPGVHLIATSSPFVGYFTKYPGVDLEGNPAADDGSARFIELPELSLSLEGDDGVVLVVGCSHSTVETIVRETREFTGQEIGLLTGGYHLLPYDRETVQGIATRLKNLGVRRVAPSHCTGHVGFKVLKDSYGDAYDMFGLGSRIEN